MGQPFVPAHLLLQRLLPLPLARLSPVENLRAHAVRAVEFVFAFAMLARHHEHTILTFRLRGGLGRAFALAPFQRSEPKGGEGACGLIVVARVVETKTRNSIFCSPSL